MYKKIKETLKINYLDSKTLFVTKYIPIPRRPTENEDNEDIADYYNDIRNMQIQELTIEPKDAVQNIRALQKEDEEFTPIITT